MKRITIFLLFISCFQVYSQNDFLTFENALRKSEKENKPVMMFFSGSDWCRPSIVFQRNILETSSFQDFKKEVVFMQLDFPLMYSNRLSGAEKHHNEDLAVRYNPQDYFPKTILVDCQGYIIHEFKYTRGMTTQDFIAQIKKEI